MKAILLLAVIALAVQAQTPVHEFFYSFVSTLQMDAATKNQVLSDGVECINYALNTLADSTQNIQHDIVSENVVAAIREAIVSAQTLENEVFPRCFGAYLEIVSFVQEYKDLSFVDTYPKTQVFQAKQIQLLAQTVSDAFFHHDSNEVAHDLATLVNTAFGLVHVELPETFEFNYENFVERDQEKYVRGFFKGFLTTLGFNNSTQVNNTAECILDISNTINTFSYLHRRHNLDEAQYFLDGVMNVTGAVERCKKLDTVDLTLVHRLISLLKEETGSTLFLYYYNAVMNLPSVVAAQSNARTFVNQGQYEAAGQEVAKYYKIVLHNLLF